jgi:hypothetical protein
MRMMNGLVKLPQLNQVMMAMAREMEKVRAFGSLSRPPYSVRASQVSLTLPSYYRRA